MLKSSEREIGKMVIEPNKSESIDLKLRPDLRIPFLR